MSAASVNHIFASDVIIPNEDIYGGLIDVMYASGAVKETAHVLVFPFIENHQYLEHIVTTLARHLALYKKLEAEHLDRRTRNSKNKKSKANKQKAVRETSKSPTLAAGYGGVPQSVQDRSLATSRKISDSLPKRQSRRKTSHKIRVGENTASSCGQTAAKTRA